MTMCTFWEAVTVGVSNLGLWIKYNLISSFIYPNKYSLMFIDAELYYVINILVEINFFEIFLW